MKIILVVAILAIPLTAQTGRTSTPRQGANEIACQPVR